MSRPMSVLTIIPAPLTNMVLRNVSNMSNVTEVSRIKYIRYLKNYKNIFEV